MTIWASWAQDWKLLDKVEFDGINRIIYVHPEVTTLDIRQDVYTSWLDWVRLRDNLKFLQAIRVTGLDSIGNGAYTGDVYFLVNGWKLSVDLQKVKVTGVLYSDDYDTAYYSTQLVAQYPVRVSSIVNTVSTASIDRNYVGPTVEEIRSELEASTILAKAADIPSTTQIVNEVRTELSQELAHILTLENNPGMTTGQATMLLELYRLAGLDPSRPLIVTHSQRNAGEISQTISSSDSETIVIRQ